MAAAAVPPPNVVKLDRYLNARILHDPAWWSVKIRAKRLLAQYEDAETINALAGRMLRLLTPRRSRSAAA